MPYQIREFSISFYYVDKSGVPLDQVIINFINSMKFPEGIRPNSMTIQIDREKPDARTPEEIEADEIEEERINAGIDQDEMES